MTAVHRGESIDKIANRVAKRMDTGVSNARRLIRTELNYVNNQAAFKSIEDSDMKYYRFIATLDRRTSTICRSHDGHVYPVSEAVAGANVPPLHSNCRSTIAGSLYGPDKVKTGTRIARDTTEKNIHIPAEMQYDDRKIVYIDQMVSLKKWQEAEENFKHHDLKNGIIEVSKTKLHEAPYAVTKKVARKGGIEWNFYDAKGTQYLQVANNDHGHVIEAGYGSHGEHSHWYDLSKKPPKIHDKATEVPSFVRKDLGDAL